MTIVGRQSITNNSRTCEMFALICEREHSYARRLFTAKTGAPDFGHDREGITSLFCRSRAGTPLYRCNSRLSWSTHGGPWTCKKPREFPLSRFPAFPDISRAKAGARDIGHETNGNHFVMLLITSGNTNLSRQFPLFQEHPWRPLDVQKTSGIIAFPLSRFSGH